MSCSWRVGSGIWPWRSRTAFSSVFARTRIDRAFRDSSLLRSGKLNIAIDGETNDFCLERTLRCPIGFRLTPYDACYLELAQRRALPLATLDNDLRKAAKALDIPLLGV